MHVHHVLTADFENELPNRFQKRQALDVTSRAADFGNDNVILRFVGDLADPIFDHVGDMGNDLHRFPEVIAAALF